MDQQSLMLTVNGVKVPSEELPRYSMRFSGKDVIEVAMYRDGKRLTVPWEFKADLTVTPNPQAAA